MNDLVKTPGARLLLFGLGVALAGGGVGVLAGEPMTTYVLAAILPGAVAIVIIASALGSLDNWKLVLATILGGPWLLWLYSMGLGVAEKRAPAAGYALVALGAGALARAVVPLTAAMRRPRPVGTPHHRPL